MSFSTTPPRPQVLFFAQNACWPPDTGAKLRNFYLVRELARFADVTYLGFAQKPSALSDWGAGLTAYCQKVITVPLAGAYSWPKIVRGLCGSVALPVLNYTTEEMTRQLRTLLATRRFDAIQVEAIHLMAYWSQLQMARNQAGQRSMLVCDWHNIESELMLRYSEGAPDPARRWYARLTARQLAALEQEMLGKFDVHTVVSERERHKLTMLQPRAQVNVVENGVDVDHFTPCALEQAYLRWERRQISPAKRRILFVGSMDYHANIDAVLFFARTVWPRLYERKPELLFTIVGRQPTAEVRALAQLPGIEVTGTVDDVRPYYCEALLAVVPLRIGGGSRLKILEAMAASVPLVSTTLGAEGLAVSDGENIMLADAPQEMYFTMLELLGSEATARKIARSGLALAQTKYDWAAIGATLQTTYQQFFHSPKQASALSGRM